MASFLPLEAAVVPSTGSTTNSTRGPRPVPTLSLVVNAGAWSFGPSQQITSPSMSVCARTALENSIAFESIRSQFPWPTCSAAPTAPATVIRVNEGAKALNETIVSFLTIVCDCVCSWLQ